MFKSSLICVCVYVRARVCDLLILVVVGLKPENVEGAFVWHRERERVRSFLLVFLCACTCVRSLARACARLLTCISMEYQGSIHVKTREYIYLFIIYHSRFFSILDS